MIPVEVDEPSLRRQLFDMNINDENPTTNLYLPNELKEKTQIREKAYKIRA